jgi:hypothetical protein
MHISCPTFGYYVKQKKKSSQHSMLQMGVLHNFILFLLLNISHHNVKTKNEGITYNGPITLWWNLNENGPRFCNTFIIKLGSHWN